jgi:hypothetical protein
MTRGRCIAACLACSWLAGPAHAQAPIEAERTAEQAADAVGFGDDTSPASPAETPAVDAVGFADDPAPSARSDAAPAPDGAALRTPEPAADPRAGQLDVTGSLAHRSALWTRRLDAHPLAVARNSLDFSLRYKKPLGAGPHAPGLRLRADGHLEHDLAYQQSHLRADEPTREVYEAQVIGRETYAALSWGAFELTVGRQIVPFGQGEILSPLDVVNPRDQREPGLAELEDLRMAVLATRLGAYVEQHRFELMVVHESYFGLRPAPLSDYSPLRALLQDDPQVQSVLAGKQLRYDDAPGRFTNGAGQLYARWSFVGAGVDLALYAASTLDKQGVPSLPPTAALLQDDVALTLWHPRYTLLGHAGALPLGSVVLRWELGVDLDRPLGVRDERGSVLALGLVRRELGHALLAVSYFGVSDTTISVEYAQSLLLEPASLPTSVDWLGFAQAPALALRVTRSLLRETLTLQLVGTWLGVDPYLGSFVRLELDYELATALHWTLGYALYAPSDEPASPLYGYTRHDRLYSAVRWDFALD